jgi:hypothetical protein
MIGKQMLMEQGVMRIAKQRKGNKNDVEAQAREIQDRLERTMGCENDLFDI